MKRHKDKRRTRGKGTTSAFSSPHLPPPSPSPGYLLCTLLCSPQHQRPQACPTLGGQEGPPHPPGHQHTPALPPSSTLPHPLRRGRGAGAGAGGTVCGGGGGSRGEAAAPVQLHHPKPVAAPAEQDAYVQGANVWKAWTRCQLSDEVALVHGLWESCFAVLTGVHKCEEPVASPYQLATPFPPPCAPAPCLQAELRGSVALDKLIEDATAIDQDDSLMQMAAMLPPLGSQPASRWGEKYGEWGGSEGDPPSWL